jgi:hypothetical protein
MLKEKLSLVWHSDAGHAWLEVTDSLIRALKSQSRISRYSYQGPDGRVYLEEDCDAPEFISAANAAGWDLKITERHSDGDSVIRSFKRY